MKTFTPLQTALALSAMSSRDAGFPGIAKAFVKALRRDMGVVEDSPEGSKARHVSQNAPNKPSYGKFSLNEADECALEYVETPRVSP